MSKELQIGREQQNWSFMNGITCPNDMYSQFEKKPLLH